MRFLWLAHAIPYPPKAGFLIRSYYLLRELAREHTVDVLAMIQEQWVTTQFPSLESGLAEAARHLQTFCNEVQFVPISRVNRPGGKLRTALEALVRGTPYATYWLDGQHARQTVQELVATHHYDLIHFDQIGLVPLRVATGDRPATLGHHNIESHMLFRRAENTGNPLLRAYFRREARLLRQVEIVSAPRFRIHITCSELDSTRLRAFVPAINVESIPNGVDCDYFRPLPARENENSLVFAGTMNWYPNVDAMKSFINSVWAGLQRNIPSITLDIVGSNPPRSLVTLANAHPGITVHGYVEDVRPYLAAAAIVICPIRDGGGTKLKLLDACAMQKCIVAHPIACEGIDVSDGVDVVLATEPREWIDAISRLLADASTRASFGINARRLVEAQYSYRSIGSRFRSLIEYAANGHGI